MMAMHGISIPIMCRQTRRSEIRFELHSGRYENIAGFTDPADHWDLIPTGAIWVFRIHFQVTLQITVDSLYIMLAGENNSGEFDTLIMQLVKVTGNAPTLDRLFCRNGTPLIRPFLPTMTGRSATTLRMDLNISMRPVKNCG
jgi:hypothetical protein